ncbi:hypothetical protein EDD85DRAFT_555844 [Armillaria nabsnona]|nr:hypothetical protein EDD85DRAFT_555844 [Armillaria nabsnona]
MQRRRDVVRKSLAAYYSTLAPIRRLPIDVLRTVLREIQLSLWWNTVESESSQDHQALVFSQGPWKLGHVCGAWRDVVLSYPQLWPHIVLRYRSPDHIPRHTILALEAMIFRSAQHPLDIVFELDVYHNESVVVPAFSTILEESYRWRSMHVRMSLTLLEPLKMARGKIPSLESLNMKISYEAYDPPYSREELHEDIRSVFIDAPRLQKVILHDAHGLGDFMFPLHITHLAACAANVSNLDAYQSPVECHLQVQPEPGPNFSLMASTFPMSDASLYRQHIYSRICAYLP